MDIVLGVSMAPTSVRMLLVEGENADGVTVEDNQFSFAASDDAATLSAADQVISAILGTREGATEAGHALTSTGVTWTDPVDAAALRDALATRKVENVMLVSSFMAAAALAQMVGCTVGDAHTALLFLEPDTATLAVIDSADGSITDVHKELMSGGHSVAELAGMVAGLEALETRPQSVFIVGSGVDVAAIKPQLEAVTTLPVTAAEEPETALAWGAALASANAPLFASSTAALAYALDPGTGAVDPYAVSPGYLAAPDVPLGTTLGEDDLAYSAVPDEDADAHTVAHAQDVVSDVHFESEPERRPLVLVGSILAVVFVAAALSLEVALALGIRPSVALLPRPLQNLIIQAPAPAPAPASVDVPEAHRMNVPAVVPPPANAPIPAPRPAAPPPAALPIPVAPPPMPAAPPPMPAAPPPVPVAAPAPVVIPLPVPIPVRTPNPVRVGPVHGPTPPVHLPEQPPVQMPEPVHVPAPPPLFPGLPGLGIPGIPGIPGISSPAPPHGSGGFGGNPGGTPGGFGGGNPGGNPGGFGGGNPGGNPGGFGGGNPGGNPGGFGGGHSSGGFGGGGFGGGGPGGFGGGPGGFGGGPGGFGGGHSSGGFGGGGFGGGGFGGGGHSGGFGGGGHGFGGHH